MGKSNPKSDHLQISDLASGAFFLVLCFCSDHFTFTNMGTQSVTERLVRANTSLARVRLHTRLGNSHHINIFFIDRSALETIITYKFKVDAADAFASFTGLFSDKLDLFKVKKYNQIRKKDGLLPTRSIFTFHLN